MPYKDVELYKKIMNREEFKNIIKEKTELLIIDAVRPKLIHKIIGELTQTYIKRVIDPNNNLKKMVITKKFKQLRGKYDEQE